MPTIRKVMPVVAQGVVSRARPLPLADDPDAGQVPRLGMYAERLVNVGLSGWHQLLDEGSVYVATNATPGTAISSDLITSYSATADGDTVIVNNNPTASRRRVYPLYIKKMLSGTAPAATTVQNFALFTDTAIQCVPSAGSVILTSNSPSTTVSGQPTPASLATVYVPTGGAAMTIPTVLTGGSRVLIGRTQLPSALGITGDVYALYFGYMGDNGFQGGAGAARSQAGSFTTFAPPVALDPGYGLIVDFWWLTQATDKPAWEWEVCWLER